MNFKSDLLLFVPLFIISCSISACSSAERSAAMVLDNAGSVIKHEGDKVWIDPNATPTPSR